MVHGFIELIRSIIAAFRTSKSGGTPAQQRRRAGGPPRCSECRTFLVGDERAAGICTACAEEKAEQDDQTDHDDDEARAH